MTQIRPPGARMMPQQAGKFFRFHLFRPQINI